MRANSLFRAVMCLLILGCIAPGAFSQVNTVNLSGTVTDPQNLAVAGAKVSVKNVATDVVREATTDGSGAYAIVGLPPGHYFLSIESAGFAKFENPGLTLTLGVAAVFNAKLLVQSGQQTVIVSAAPELVETTKSAVSNTITSVQINNLPINGRNYINFTLLDSQANRDSAPAIGPAPTTGLNFGGQRARSNEISVDGADAIDNATNGVRATVSQEAVQEFQLITSNYMPEYGRATGGVVNIVTKSGSNQVHGDMFGYLRDSAIQARNPFSVQVDPVTGDVVGVKQPFTRVQAGATIGGPLRKDKTFYFFSYEATRREETGFSDIGTGVSGTGLFGLIPSTTPVVPGVTLPLTPQQNAFVNNATAIGANPQAVAEYFLFAGSGSSVATTGIDPGIISGAGPGPRFPLPVDGTALAPLPASYVPLIDVVGNYPISEKTSLYSLRLDQIWNAKNTTFIRASISPSLVTGIQSNDQNQNSGENAGSRTGLQQTRDFALVVQHTTAISDTMFNEFRYQFARRGLHYGYSDLPGGSNVGVNIPGFGFFGREPFSTVDRIEKRNQWTDNLTWVMGNHTAKAGLDVNFIQTGSNDPIIFQLDFGGEYNFGSLSPSDLSLPSDLGGVAVPGFTGLQAYGLGIPQNFIQGVGSTPQPRFNVPTIGVFLQDSWKVNRRLTLNYGLRYDIEYTPQFLPATYLNAQAEKALNIIEGIPVDANNVAPRFGFAWDPTGSGKTVVRGGYGLYYDHPLLAIAFDSTTADGARNSQLILPGSTPTAACIATNPSLFNASSVFQGVLNTCGIPGINYESSQQRFDPFNSPFFNYQNYLSSGFPLSLLPFNFPVTKNFVYAYAQQATLGIEREISPNWKFSAQYNLTLGTHLNRPRDANSPENGILIGNDSNAIAAGLVPVGTSPLSIAIPVTAGCVPTAAGGGVLVTVPGILGVGYTNPTCSGAPLGPIGTAAVFNFFRPSGPNPSYAGLVGGYPSLVAIAGSAGFPVGFSNGGVPVAVPFSSVDQQESSGNSNYNALTITMEKRFSNHMQLLSSYTWSHAIDDSTDLQSLLEPQDDRFANLERANSTFDQRQRWVTSAVFQTPYKMSDTAWWQKFLADFTFSPIVELSSGRPYTVLTGTDFNLNFASNTDRPSVAPVGTPGAVTSPYVNNVAFVPASVCPGITSSPLVPTPPVGCDGSLGRNTFTRPGLFNVDARLSRNFSLSERWNLQIIADAFNLFNRYNVSDVNVLCDPTGSGACDPGQPAAVFDQRQFQFAMKIIF